MSGGQEALKKNKTVREVVLAHKFIEEGKLDKILSSYEITEEGIAAAWAGKRALVTMKMSGVNVVADSLASVAYSGCTGDLVIFVADDPGVSAGMPEEDSRYYAKSMVIPMLDLASQQ